MTGHSARWLLVAVAAVTSTLFSVSVANASARALQSCRWQGTPTYISGTSTYSRGEFIYSDYIHDDYGANVDGFNSSDLDPPNPITGVYPNPQDPTSPWVGGTGNQFTDRFRHTGDYAYPSQGVAGTPTYPGGYYDVADILDYREKLAGHRLCVLVHLGAMTAKDSTVVGIGIHVLGNNAIGADTWPLGANVTTPLHYDYFITMWGTGGQITDFSHTPAVTKPIEVWADTAARPPFMEAEVPLPADAPLGGVWRTWVGSGLWDPANRRWRTAVTINQTGSPGNVAGTFPNVYNLLFRPHEPNSYWDDTEQADDLAKQDIAPDHADIHMRWLAERRSLPAPEPTGLLELQYRTMPLGDGEGEETNWSSGPGTFVYKGPWQPYSLMLPSDFYRKRHPRALMLFFHPSNTNHNTWPFGVEGSATPGKNDIINPILGTSHVQDIVDRNDIMVAGTLQRGEKGPAGPSLPWSDVPGIGEADLLDVLHNVESRFAVNRNRLIFSGMSYGGQTTDAMMTLYPDLLAAAVAHSSDGNLTDPTNAIPARLENIRNVFYMQISGDTGLDSQAPYVGRQEASELDAMGYRHMYIEYLGRAHDFDLVYQSLPIIEQTAWRQVRDPNPARVTYEVDSAVEQTDKPLGISHNHAYWVSGLMLAPGAARGTIDATALPLAAKLPHMLSHLSGTFFNTLTGQGAYVDWQAWNTDLRGHGLQDFQAGWQPGPDVTVTDTMVPQPPHARENAFTLTTNSGLEAATLDLGRMDISVRREASGYLQCGRPLVLILLTSGRVPGRVTLDGRPLAMSERDGGIVLQVPAGSHTLKLSEWHLGRG